MAKFDVIAATRDCAAYLHKLGLADWSSKLLNALDSASTGGELVMAVRWHLQQLESLDKELPDDVLQLSRRIVQEINSTGW